MMRHANPRNSIDHVNGGGLLLRLRAWFAGGAAPSSAMVCEPCHAVSTNVAASNVISRDAISRQIGARQGGLSWVEQAANHDTASSRETAKTATLLPFPIRGEALLVKLAVQLRSKVANAATSCEPFDLTISRHSHLRLTIDAAAHVEFHAGLAIYHLVIELVSDTRIKVESVDFDTIVRFIAQYVTDRLSGEILREAVS